MVKSNTNSGSMRMLNEQALRTTIRVVGSLLIVIATLLLLLQTCHTCHSSNTFKSIVLPSVGLCFGLFQLIAPQLKKPKLTAFTENMVIVAGIISPLPIGLMLLGFVSCPLCIAVWLGVFILLLGLKFRSENMEKIVWLGLIVSVILIGIIRVDPVTYREAVRSLVAAGLTVEEGENGPEEGSKAPQHALLPKDATVVLWTQCKCPLFQLEAALKTLQKRQKDVPIVIVASKEVPEMKQWAPTSPLIILSEGMMLQQWNIQTQLPHTIVEVRNGVVVSNQSTVGVK